MKPKVLSKLRSQFSKFRRRHDHEAERLRQQEIKFFERLQSTDSGKRPQFTRSSGPR